MRNTIQNTPEKTGPGWAPGANLVMAKIKDMLVGGGKGKKLSGRTPREPRRAPAHHLNRWRDEGRQALVLEAIRLGVLDPSRPAIGPRFGFAAGQFRTWKTLAVAVERARRIKLQDVGM